MKSNLFYMTLVFKYDNIFHEGMSSCYNNFFILVFFFFDLNKKLINVVKWMNNLNYR